MPILVTGDAVSYGRLQGLVTFHSGANVERIFHIADERKL